MPFGWVAGAAAVFGAYEQYSSAQSQQNIAQTQQQMAGQIFAAQGQYRDALSQLIANPSSVTSLPGYQFQFNQGADALTREMAAQGYGPGSGNLGVALTQYGQQFAQSAYGQQANILAGLSGLQTSTSPAQYGQVASGAGAQSSNQYNQLFANLGYLSGGGFGSFGSAGGSPAMGGFGPNMGSGGDYGGYLMAGGIGG